VLLNAFVGLYRAICICEIQLDRPSVLLLRCQCLAAVMDRLYRSNAEDAWGISAMILFDDVSDDDSIDDAKESEENYVEQRESDSECAQDARSVDHCCTEVYATDVCFHCKGQDEVG